MSQKLYLPFFLLFFFAHLSYGQVTPERIKQFLESEDLLRSAGIRQVNEVREFYTGINYTPAWIEEANEYNRDKLIDLLHNANEAGLNKNDYQYDFIQSFEATGGLLRAGQDSLIAEIRLSDAAIHFFSDFLNGNTKPLLSYEGLDYTPGCNNIARLLTECISKNQLCLLDKWEPRLAEIILIRKKIKQIEEAISSGLFKEELITSTVVSQKNEPLIRKLYYLGITDLLYLASDGEVKEKIKEAQRQFNLLADGILRSTALKELNTPVATRLQQLNLSINYYRWLYCLTRQEPVIVVNIPAAYLKVYSPEGIKLEMRMIVGKPSTPTPTLSSRVTEVILYPYWMVPRSIATKELLPSLKRNPGFANENNFQIISSQGKIIDPYKVDWQSLNASNFPYTIRQSTGCDNSLGVLKLNFYNPYNVYLHDTPSKSLFMLNKRYFSHGCMRMENPIEMGHLVLKNNSIAIDTLEDKGCLLHQSPVVVKAEENLPVIVWYNPVGIDSSGRVIFYEDIYRKLKLK